MNLKDLEIYRLSMELGEKVYDAAINMDYFDKDTSAKQWVRAMDSVSLNISEGFGRYSYRDQRNFYYFSRGSLNESATCLEKARNRKQISEEMYEALLKEHNILAIKLNNFINSVTKLINNTK